MGGHAVHEFDVCKCARKHSMFLRAQAHISAKLGGIRKIEIFTESGGHAGHDYDVSAGTPKHARMLACMHTIFWRA